MADVGEATVSEVTETVVDHVRYFDPRECITLCDTMGGDLRVVNAARVSFANHVDEARAVTARDENLIRFLARHDHVTPFFHPQLMFRIRMPIYLAREWFKHTVGVARNEESRRYVTYAPDCFLPEQLRRRNPDAKQGSLDVPVDDGDALRQEVHDYMERGLALYDKLLRSNVAPEHARGHLPQAMMTEWVETLSLAACARIYGLRNQPDAMREIQGYARAMGALVEQAYPVAWRALVDKQRRARQTEAVCTALEREYPEVWAQLSE